jgi:hypothetical protein
MGPALFFSEEAREETKMTDLGLTQARSLLPIRKTVILQRFFIQCLPSHSPNSWRTGHLMGEVISYSESLNVDIKKM